MADASCSGPSPFKRLVEHQNRDVSHHQDRIVDHVAPHNRLGAFRSAPSHPAQAQNDFGAFMDGSSSMADHHHAAGRLAAHAAALDPSHAMAAPSPMAAHMRQHHAASPAPAADMSNWAADFARQSNRGLTQQQQQPQAPVMQNGFAQQPSGMQMNFQAAFAQQNGAFGGPMYNPGMMNPMAQQHPPATQADFDEEMSLWMAAHGGAAGATTTTGGMADVDAVMDQMAKDLEAAEQEAAATGLEDRNGNQQHFTDLDTPEIGNLSLEPQPQAADTVIEEQEAVLDPVDDQKGRSEVSEAAERLLESVQHEDGDKWKNSVFLSLMRDFRDGRKDIVDNEIRETDENGEQQSAPQPRTQNGEEAPAAGAVN